MTDLNSRKFADDLIRQMDSRVARGKRDRLTLRYGIVDQVDTGARKVSVFIGGNAASSPNFTYGEVLPVPGDLVALILTPDGGRFVLRILSRDAEDSSTFAFFVS